MSEPFWETKSLSEMTAEEWESLCDGCAQCCLHKVEDEDTGDIYNTNLACKLMDMDTCQCSDYANRKTEVPDCLQLTPENVEEIDWLPPSCAYKRLAKGEPLLPWHPLISGSPDTVHDAGISVLGQVLSEQDTDEYSELRLVFAAPD